MRRNDAEGEYRTRNLPLAQFILAKGAEIPEIRGERGHVEFIFPDPEERLGWEYELFKADEPIGVQQFLWAQKELRAQMDKKFGPRQ
jgi:hypothetical protein